MMRKESGYIEVTTQENQNGKSQEICKEVPDAHEEEVLTAAEKPRRGRPPKIKEAPL